MNGQREGQEEEDSNLAARALWRLSILSRPGKQKLIRSSRNVCSPYDSSTGDSETRLPDLLFLPGRNSFAPLESPSTGYDARRLPTSSSPKRRPDVDGNRPSLTPRLRSTPTLLPLLLLLYFSLPPPSLPPLRPKVFLFPPLAVKRGGEGRGGGEEVLSRDLAEERRERELSFLIFHGSSTPINWFTSNVYRAANELLLSALVLSSELQIVGSSPAFREISWPASSFKENENVMYF